MKALRNYIKNLNTPPGPPTQQGIYASPEWTGQPYPSIDWEAITQNQEPPEGWPRPPKFNEPGDVPGPPVQFGDPITPETVEAGFNFVDNGIEEKNVYFYHPDHLGSSSHITDVNGDLSQHTEFMAFGEILFDEHSVSITMPYLFNGKELDSDTNLTYYGARYLDMKTSLWLNVDPLADRTLQSYQYANNNPIMFIDPTGMESESVDDIIIRGRDSKEWRVKTAGDDKVYNVPFNLKNSVTMDLGLKDIDPNRFAVGYTIEGNISGSFGIGGSGGVEMSIVQFTDNKYSGYNYVYGGVNEQISVGAQFNISATLGGNVFIAYNTSKNDIDPITYSGITTSVGLSADIKYLVGGGINVAVFSGSGRESGWKGVSLGMNTGIGAGANLGSGAFGLSKTWLLNDVKPTAERTMFDRASNMINPIGSAIMTGGIDKIKQYKRPK